MFPSAIIGGILDGRQRLVSWGWLQITVANLVVIIAMIALFVLALVVPFPKAKK